MTVAALAWATAFTSSRCSGGDQAIALLLADGAGPTRGVVARAEHELASGVDVAGTAASTEDRPRSPRGPGAMLERALDPTPATQCLGQRPGAVGRAHRVRHGAPRELQRRGRHVRGQGPHLGGARAGGRAPVPSPPSGHVGDDACRRVVLASTASPSGVASKMLSASWTIRMPSAIAWCARKITALPPWNPSTSTACHSGSLRSSGTVRCEAISSCSSASPPGSGSTTRS